MGDAIRFGLTTWLGRAEGVDPGEQYGSERPHGGLQELN